MDDPSFSCTWLSHLKTDAEILADFKREMAGDLETIRQAREDPELSKIVEEMTPDFGPEPESKKPPVQTVEKDNPLNGIIRVENKNISVHLTKKQIENILKDKQELTGEVWGNVTDINKKAMAFAYINSEHYYPYSPDKNGLLTEFSGETSPNEIKAYAARRRYAQKYIKTTLLSREDLPELIRVEYHNEEELSKIISGKSHQLSGMTPVTADKSSERRMELFFGVSPSNKVVKWHYRRDDAFESRVGSVRITDGGDGTDKSPYELTLGGNSVKIDKVELVDKITHIFVHFEED